MERLIVSEIMDIVYRLRKGQSQRTIAEELDYHRATVRRYYQIARDNGFLNPEKPLPEPGQLLAALGDSTPPPRVQSSVAPFASVVVEWLKAGIEARAIHRMLTEGHGFTGSYSAVRRFATAHQPPAPPAVCVRIETEPGEEAQVDFGTVGNLLDAVGGKARIAYCFVMTLSYSRHQYVEFVFDQKIPRWIGCHMRAFAHFGGVPKRLVVDNLKAAVIRDAMADPILGAAYREMARHCGTLISPCRPRTPTHKGKVESGVGFVKRNLFAGLAGKTLEAANAAAMEWVMGYAGHRDHGTTHKAPLAEFTSREASALIPLARDPFTLLETRTGLVQRDCHVTVDGSYYPAPNEYVGIRLDVHIHESTVQLYDGVKLLVTHERCKERGGRPRRPDFYPEHKARYLARTKWECIKEATAVGPACLQVVDALFSDRPKDARRAVASLVGLADQFASPRVEAACVRAIAWGDPTYKRVRAILRDNLDETWMPKDEQRAEPAVSYRHARKAEEFFGAPAGSASKEKPC